MTVLLLTFLFYLLGLVATAAGSRLAGRCATWCCALCGFPVWVVGGSVATLCVALPQLMLAFLAAGLGATGLAAGVALAGAAANIGLALALCLLRRDVTVDWSDFCGKCGFLLAAALVLALFVRDSLLSYTGTGLLMLLFVLYMLHNIVCQYRLANGLGGPWLAVGPTPPAIAAADAASPTLCFPVMSVRNALRNLAGVVGGLALLSAGASGLMYSTTALASLTGTIQALWAATLIGLGFSLPLLAEVLHHPFGTVWKAFAERCRYYPPQELPLQLLGSAVLNITLVLPLSSLMYRQGRLPLGAQFRLYDVPLYIAFALLLLVPPLLKKRLYRWQGAACLAVYLFYLAAVLLAPNASA